MQQAIFYTLLYEINFDRDKPAIPKKIILVSVLGPIGLIKMVVPINASDLHYKVPHVYRP